MNYALENSIWPNEERLFEEDQIKLVVQINEKGRY